MFGVGSAAWAVSAHSEERNNKPMVVSSKSLMNICGGGRIYFIGNKKAC